MQAFNQTKVLRAMAISMCVIPTISFASDVNVAELPPVLDFYPNCQYQVIDSKRVAKNFRKPNVIEHQVQIISEIRKRAKEVNADAVILTEKKIKQGEYHFGPDMEHLYKLSYSAELIRNCDAGDDLSRPARYNQEGNRVRRVEGSRISLTLNSFSKVEEHYTRPAISDFSLSLQEGIYGVPLGSTYQQVVAKLGDPSAELFHYDNQRVIGYGRRHWFYFEQDSLVRVQSLKTELSQVISSEIPYWQDYDQHAWLINSKVGKSALLSEVIDQLELDSSTKLNKNSQLVLTDKGNKLVLQFTYSKDPQTNKKRYSLSYFDYHVSDYKKAKALSDIAIEPLLNQLSQAYSSLDKQPLTSAQLNLSKPLAVIKIEPELQLKLFGNSLLVKQEKQRISQIRLEQGFFEHLQPTELAWALGPYQYGASMNKLSSYFDKSALIMPLDVVLEHDNYTLNLAFDDSDGTPVLYQAKLQLF